MSNDEPPAREIRRVVLVTGASSGIGKVCAEHLPGKGYRVFGAQRSSPGLHSGVETITMDVDDDQSVKTAVDALLAKVGRIDVVINNAGFALMGSIEDTSIEEARRQMETNFFGALRVIRAVLPAMREQRDGLIINISSLAGVLGLPFSGLYSASKFALEGLSETLRLETRQFGIKVVLIEPGDFSTQLPAKRQTAKESQGTASAYAAAFTKFKANQDKDEAKAPTPEPIARLVEKILKSPSPRQRYAVGMLGQRIVVPMKKILPQRLFEWALIQALSL